ncbi:hypothetical protein QJQ45_013724, partial [Haematococcus lacustris]
SGEVNAAHIATVRASASPRTPPGKQREERRAEWKTQRRQVRTRPRLVCPRTVCVPASCLGLSKSKCQNVNCAWLQVIKVPGGCKKTKRKLMAHFQLRVEVHSQLRVIASLFVIRIFLTCLVGYPTPGYRSATEPPAVQPPQAPNAPPLPPLPPRAPAQPPPAQPASMECDSDSDSESDCDSEPESLSDLESEPEPQPLKDFNKFFANPNFKTVYNQLQRGLVRPGQHCHPILMPVFEDPSNQALLAKLQELGSIDLIERFLKLYTKAARARLDWSGEEAQLFIKMRSQRRDEGSGQLVADKLAQWKLTKGQVKHASGLNNARCTTQRRLAPIKPHLQHLPAASSAGTSLEANLKHITVTLATWDAVLEVYLDPKWARQRLRLYGAQDQALEQFFKKVRVGGPRGKGQQRGRVVLVDEHRTSRVSSAVNGKQPCEEELNHEQPTRPKRSKRTKAEPAAEPNKGKGKAAKAKPAPQPGRWFDRDCNAALNIQRTGESRWRPLELCWWPEQGKLTAKGKEYPGLGYKRLRHKSPKAQEQQPAVAL